MDAHWFIVANEKTINIFTEVNKRNKLQLIRTFENPVPEEASCLPFAKELVNFLKKEHQLKHFENLTVAAEPHFLGKIRQEMKPPLEKMVTHWIQKDLLKIPKKELPGHLPLHNPEPVGPQ